MDPIQQTPVQSALSPTPMPEPPKNLGCIKWVLTVTIVALISSAGTYFILKSQSQNQTPPPQDIQIPPTITLTPDPTANWKTYIDNKLGFSIKYPSEITILRSFPEGGVEFVKKQNLTKDFREINSLSIYFRGIAGSSPENTFKNGECGKPCNENTKNVNINNAVGITTLGPNYPNPDNYYLTNDTETAPVIRISILNNPADSDKDLKPFQKMISTFKFTDQISPTSSNPEGKFCGGIAANLPENQCPTGYTCKLDGNYPDAGGKCVQQ